MFAVIKTGGKQYLVSSGQKIKIEKIEGKEGDKVNFKDVLLLAGEGNAKIGNPNVAGASVSGEIVKQARSKKVIVFKYHSKARVRKTKGHRQYFTEVKINDVK